MSKGFLYYIFSLPLPEIKHSSTEYLNSSSSIYDFEKEPLVGYNKYNSSYSSSSVNSKSDEALQDLYENTKRTIFDFFTQSVKSEHRISDIKRLELPQFKIGTLDSLIGISDELTSLDAQYETIATRFINNLKTLLSAYSTTSSSGGPLPSQSVESYLMIGDKSLEQYICQFSWNGHKYRSDRPISEIVSNLNTEVNAMDIAIKTKMNSFTSLKTNLIAVEKMNSGNLAVKNLSNVINVDNWNKHNLFSQSEYIETILVAVPLQLCSEWENSYETLTELVVPRSATEIARDKEYVLYSVHVFHKMASLFKVKAKELKYTVREFVPDMEEAATEKKKQEQMTSQVKEQWTHLVRLLKTNFAEVFSAWIHLKIIRLFVESVLRYGLPPIYMTVLVKSHKISDKKIPAVLLENIFKLDLPGISKVPKISSMLTSSAASTHSYQSVTSPSFANIESGLLAEGLDKDYLPFVLMDIKWTI